MSLGNVARVSTIIIIFGATLGSSGCSISKMAANNMAPVLLNTEAEFLKQKSLKNAREAAPGLLATLDGLIATSPRNPDLLIIGARMNATFAFGFLEDEDRERAKDTYAHSLEYATRALVIEDDDVAALLAKATPDGFAARLKDAASKDDLPALFWWAFAKGSIINLSRSDPKALADLWLVEEVMKWVLEHDESYYYAGPHLFFAVRYASFAKAMGGSPSEAKKHFEDVDRLMGGKLLLGRVLRAQFYASQLQETPAKATVEQIQAAQKAAWAEFYPPLVSVLQAKDDVWPEQMLTTQMAKARAKALLEKPSKANIIPPQGVENPYAKKRREEDE